MGAADEAAAISKRMQKNGAMEADFKAGIERPFGPRAARQAAISARNPGVWASGFSKQACDLLARKLLRMDET